MLRDKIKKYIKISGGNSGLTEEFIYNNQEFDKKNAIKVYSGATQKNNMMKSINPNVKINGKKIKVFTNEGILIARKGKAGALTYINDAQYTLNDDAYIMQVKDEYKNNISIKYLMFALKKEIDSWYSEKTIDGFYEAFYDIKQDKAKEIIKDYPVLADGLIL